MMHIRSFEKVMRRSLWSMAVAASFFAGCGTADEGEIAVHSESGALTTDGVTVSSRSLSATLEFKSDWSESVAGTLVAGGKMKIEYDASRLPRCRASHNGNPGWQITAYARFLPSGETVEAGLFTYEMTDSGPDYHTWIPVTPEFDVPVDATGVELWFYNRSAFDNPCEAWDSDYGRNYRFSVEPQSSFASMLFQTNWQNILSGQVARGGVLSVQYAPERMHSIVSGAQVSGIPYFAAKYHCYGYGCCSFAYDTSVNVRFKNGAAFEKAPIGDLAVMFDIPSDADRVELYFDTAVTTTTWYCGGTEGDHYEQPTKDFFYDSNYGRNFQYTIP